MRPSICKFLKLNILRLFSISVTDKKRMHRQTIDEDNAGKHRGFILSAALPNTRATLNQQQLFAILKSEPIRMGMLS